MTDQPFSLLRNLARAEQPNADRDDGQLSFVEAMSAMDISSVFDIVRRAKPAFVRELRQYSDANGDLAYENACCYATQIVRLYRNQLVSSGRMQSLTRRTGVRSLVDIGPSFPNLFKENWDLFCKVGAIEAKDSPAAYLASLYRFAKEQLEGSDDEVSRIHLDVRRPDLKDLVIDQQTTFTPVPTLEIVNNVLSRAIHEYTDTVEELRGRTILQLVADRKHPFLFPYNFHHRQVTLALSGKKPRLGELNYCGSREVPATSAGSAAYGSLQHGSAIAQILMSGLSPQLQAIVLAPPLPSPTARTADGTLDPGQAHDGRNDPTVITRFFKDHYDSEYLPGTANPLDLLKLFMDKTGLESQAVEALLAVHDHAPYSSPNVTDAGNNAAGSGSAAVDPPIRYGACYVNGPARLPAMELSTDATGITRLLHSNVDRFDRLQRMIRLQLWMEIPFGDLDTVIMAVIRSQDTENPEWLLTATLLRTLGIYRYLHRQYKLGPQEFAAFVGVLSVHANDGRLSMFDQVFNNPLLFDSPLKLDGTTFELAGTDSGTARTLAQLCSGLHLPQTREDLWPLATDTRELIGNAPQPLKRSLKIVSSLYRQTRIAAMFGLTARDSRALLDLLGGESYRKKVVTGELRTASNGSDTEPDVLDILMQMDWTVTWLTETGYDVATLRRQLGIDGVPAQISQSLIDQLNQLAKDANESKLRIELLKFPLFDDWGEPIHWIVEVLAPLISGYRLVIAPAVALAENLPAAFKTIIQTQLAPVELSEAVKTDLSARFLEVILKAYLAQHRLMEDLLQTRAELPQDRCETVMRWAGSSADHFLGELLAATSGAPLSLPLTEAGMAVIDSLMNLMRHAEVSLQLGLSAQALRTFLAMPRWLRSRMPAPLKLSLETFYLLDRYRVWRDSSGHPEPILLDYLRLANSAESVDADEHAQRCASALAPLSGWNASELLIASAFLSEHGGIAVSMHEVDWVIRIRAVGMLTGLGAEQTLKTTALAPSSATEHWKAVGEAVMAAARR